LVVHDAASVNAEQRYGEYVHPYTFAMELHPDAVCFCAHASTTPTANSALLKLCRVARLNGAGGEYGLGG
jgi:hypothetical protein